MSNRTSTKKWEIFERSLLYLKREFPPTEVLAVLAVFVKDDFLVKGYGDKRLFYAIAARVLETDARELERAVEKFNSLVDGMTLCAPDGSVIFQNGQRRGQWAEGGEA